MTWVQRRLPFILIILLSCIVLILSIWDIIYNQEWIQGILAVYGILIILAIVLLFLKTKEKSVETTPNVEEFEKTLKGKLSHFKCPNCNGIFAIKKSKHNNKNAFILTCPDCGNVGKIPSKPQLIEDEIPEKKSPTTRFKCGNCGEWISIWAEGADLFKSIQIYSCPYCGIKQSMSRTASSDV